MTNELPPRLYARLKGFGTQDPSLVSYLTGFWQSEPDIGLVEYIRADLVKVLITQLPHLPEVAVERHAPVDEEVM